jgi:membrane fusion protein, multidrug efflux system
MEETALKTEPSNFTRCAMGSDASLVPDADGSPRSDNVRPFGKDEAKAKSPAPNAAPGETGARQPADRRGFLRRRPVLSAIGAVLLGALVGGGYLYVDNSGHYQSTDDAFVAARQTTLAPKVAGYITACPSPTTSMSPPAT